MDSIVFERLKPSGTDDELRSDSPLNHIVAISKHFDIQLDFNTDKKGQPIKRYPEEICIADWFTSKKSVSEWNQTLANVKPEQKWDQKVRFCNQLDAATSGIVLLALTKEAAGCVGNQFATRKTVKHYDAIVHGWPEWDQCEIDYPIYDVTKGSFLRACEVTVPGSEFEIESSGDVTMSTPSDSLVRGKQDKVACTRVEMVKRGYLKCTNDYDLGTSEESQIESMKVSLVRIKILTGRRHQIRVHMLYKGFPIVGDLVYNWVNVRQTMDQYSSRRQSEDLSESPSESKCVNHRKTFRMFLHAAKLGFPELGNVEYRSESGFEKYVVDPT